MADDFVKVKILAFGCVRELLKTDSEITLSSKWFNDQELKDFLCDKQYPQLSKQKNTLILALNEQYLHNAMNITLKNSDLIAIIPPITGG